MEGDLGTRVPEIKDLGVSLAWLPQRLTERAAVGGEQEAGGEAEEAGMATLTGTLTAEEAEEQVVEEGREEGEPEGPEEAAGEEASSSTPTRRPSLLLAAQSGDKRCYYNSHLLVPHSLPLLTPASSGHRPLPPTWAGP